MLIPFNPKFVFNVGLSTPPGGFTEVVKITSPPIRVIQGVNSA